MIGKAYWATFKYYDSSLHKMAFKKRPILIIGQIWIPIMILKCR